MKISKRSKLQSVFLLLALIFQTIYPTSAYAMSDGPEQPEYGSYEDFNATDMVNLISGDFTYNIPLLNVPSPEGGFQMPLSYHAGIELNEDASWVGLGWNLNPGAIARNVSMYPDDYCGQAVNTSISGSGGNGYISSGILFTQYYDSQKGYGGAVNLLGIADFGWGTQKHFGIAPLGLTLKNGQVSYDAQYMAMGLYSAMSLVVGHYGGPLINTISTVYSVASAISAKSSQGTQTAGFGDRNVKMESSTTGSIWKHTSYKWSLEGSKSSSNFGALYLGDMSMYSESVSNAIYQGDEIKAFNVNASNAGSGSYDNTVRYFHKKHNLPNPPPASDMYIHYGSSYANEYNPASLSYDDYNIMAPTVGGAIEPYRKDMGSLSHPCKQERFEYSLMGPTFRGNTLSNNNPDYKVQFKYRGDFSNSYTFHHLDNSNNNNQALHDQGFPYAIDGTQTGPAHTINTSFTDPKVYVNYPASNADWNIHQYNNNYSINNSMEADRAGLFKKKLIHKKHIEWFSNHEINTNLAKTGGFINYHNFLNRAYDPQEQVPDKGIGGFSITNELGMTYHFALPIYNKSEVSIAKDNSTSPAVKYITHDDNWYATTWLLTGITGPDFVDRSNNGIIDDNDWGYWVKFDYGRYASDFGWRNPYNGTFKNGNFETMKKGVKETYYLNRITTRTHSALFMKYYRTDGASYFESTGVDEFSDGTQTEPSQSLYLQDIYVLENADCHKLMSSTGVGGDGLNVANSDNSSLTNGDNNQTVLDLDDIYNQSNYLDILDHLKEWQLQKIHFEQDYSLCGSVPTIYNPLAYPAGKLTLKEVQFFGKNDSHTVPGYTFEYGDSSDDNPNYDQSKYDGWGMYKSGGYGDDGTPHNSEKKGDQWSLTKITTPLGAELNIEYERDSYSSINGDMNPCVNSPHKVYITGASASANSVTYNSGHTGTTMSGTDLYGSSGTIKFYYLWTNPGPSSGTGSSDFTTAFTHGSGSTLNLSTALPWNLTTIYFAEISTPEKYGGGIRVKSITVEDEVNEYKTKYIYTKNEMENGVTSGVASFEPESDRTGRGQFAFYDYYDHPKSTILYSKVTVVNGDIDNTKEKSRQVFRFTTPDQNMLQVNPSLYYNDTYKQWTTGDLDRRRSAAWGSFTTINNTLKIGNLDTVKLYNHYDNLISQTVYKYTDNSDNFYGNHMGHYTENTILWEFIHDLYELNVYDYRKFRFFQSYKLNRPNILKSVTTTKDRLVSKHEILSYDYLTGEPLLTKNTYGGIERYENEVIPAYTKYPALASKAYGPRNKNILTAPAETRSYVYDKNGIRKLLSAAVMTWDSVYYNRNYNTSTSLYENQQNATNSGPYYKVVWQPKSTYSWKALVNEDGTLITNSSDPEKYIPFNWYSSVLSPKWIKTSEITTYDHFSHPLESKDLNGQYSSVKYGYEHAYPIGTCNNAKYAAWCFSGAEDKSPDGNYMHGEVSSGGGLQSTSNVHTGAYSLRIPPNQKGFEFTVNKTDLTDGKYRASVWVHATALSNAELTCNWFNGSGSPVSPAPGLAASNLSGYHQMAPATIEQAGSWFLLNLTIDLSQSLLDPNIAYVKFYIRNKASAGTSIYADDFRVHPLNSPIAANVYNPKNGKVIATLGEDNYGTKLFYDDEGKLISVYKETKNGFYRVSQSLYGFKQ